MKFELNKEIVVFDTETTGIFSKSEYGETLAPQMTQIAAINFELQKDLSLVEIDNKVIVTFNDETLEIPFSKKDESGNYVTNFPNNHIIKNGILIIVDNIPLLKQGNKVIPLFTNNITLKEKENFIQSYNTTIALDPMATAVTLIVNKEILASWSDQKKANFILTVFNKVGTKLLDVMGKDTYKKWEKMVADNNISVLSTMVNQFIIDAQMDDISVKGEDGVYVNPYLNKEEKAKLVSLLDGKILAGHNVASFDYMNVLKGNGVELPNSYLVDTMFFEKKGGKGNSLDANILHYLSIDLNELKKAVYSKDIENSITRMLLKFKEGVKALEEILPTFDDKEIEIINGLKNPLKERLLKSHYIVQLINQRRYSHGAELDVRLNAYVLEKKMNGYFQEKCGLYLEKKIGVKTFEKAKGDVIEPLGLIGLATKDTSKNIITQTQLVEHLEKAGIKNVVIVDENPRNFYKFNKTLAKKEIKNSLAYKVNLSYSGTEFPLKIIIPNTASNALLSLLSQKEKRMVIDYEGMKDLVLTGAKVIIPLELKEFLKEINSKNLVVGLDMLHLPEDNIIKELEQRAIFIAEPMYGTKKDKALKEIVWDSIQENEKIDQAALVNSLHDKEIGEDSLERLDKDFITNIYSTYPTVGKNSNNIIEELSSISTINPIIYDKNIFLSPKKLGLTDKEFETPEEYKTWFREFMRKNIDFTHMVSPYITALYKYIEMKNETLFSASRDEHLAILNKELPLYTLLQEINLHNLTTIEEKMNLIKQLMTLSSDFKPFVLDVINEYNESIEKELDVIFDMPGKGVSNGHNLLTTREVILEMDRLLAKKLEQSIEIPSSLKFLGEKEFYSDNLEKMVDTILDVKNKKTIETLITQEQNQRSVGPGRGSAGGSLVAYNIQITNIDPKRFNLLFERFLNPERITPPDIDADFPFSDNQKGLTIEKFLGHLERIHGFKDDELKTFLKSTGLSEEMIEKYGHYYEMIKKLSTEVEATGKNIFRKVLSVMGVQPLKINDYSRTYNDDKSIIENIQEIPNLWNVYCVLKEFTIEDLENLTMNTGKAASAVVLNMFTPVLEDKTIPFTKNSDGLLDNKLDILSLATMRQNLLMQRIIMKDNNLLFNYNLDSVNDPDVLLDIQEGRTGVVFQIEGDTMTKPLKELFPLDYQAIADTSAIQRPGPAQWASAPYYMNRALKYQNYFRKFFSKELYDKKPLEENDIKELYEKIKDKNKFVSFISKKNGERRYILNYEQFKNIMTITPFLESPEFIKITALHTEQLLSTRVSHMLLKDLTKSEEIIAFKEEYKDINKGLTAIEEIYFNKLLEIIPTLDSEKMKSLHKYASIETTKELKSFEYNLLNNKEYKEITDKTYGTLVYQEDIMVLVQKMGGFTIGAADILRRAISKKGYDLSGTKAQIVDNLSNQVIALETDKVRFYKDNENHLMMVDNVGLFGEVGKEHNLGDTYFKEEEEGKFKVMLTTNSIYLDKLQKNVAESLKGVEDVETVLGVINPSKTESIKNLSKLEAEYLYEKMKSFAGYAFNKSHADAYTNITYMTGYLKTHYPTIFYNTILRNGNEANAQNLLREINVYGLEMIIPTPNDINLRDNSKIVFPISKIKGVKADIEIGIHHLKETLFKNEPITDVIQLYRNLGKGLMNKTTVVGLAEFGFFNSISEPLKEKTITDNIDVYVQTLETIEKMYKDYFITCIEKIIDKPEQQEKRTTNDSMVMAIIKDVVNVNQAKENKKMLNNYVDNYFKSKQIILDYEIQEQRNQLFEFGSLEIEKPESAFNVVAEFESNFPDLVKAYSLNKNVGEYKFEMPQEIFFKVFEKEMEKSVTKKLKDEVTPEAIKESLETLHTQINDNSYYQADDKQTNYATLLKEYNFFKNIVRAVEIDPKLAEEKTKEFNAKYKKIYHDKNSKDGKVVEKVEFKSSFIGKKPSTLILVPNTIKMLNEKTDAKTGAITISPKLKLNGMYAQTAKREIEVEKQFTTSYGNTMVDKAVQRLYIDKDKTEYHDFIVQSNGVFYIGSHDTETLINEKGFPSEKPIIDKDGKTVSAEKLELLGITIVEKDYRSFNPVVEQLIEQGIDIETVMVVPCMGNTADKVEWFGNKDYKDLVQSYIQDLGIKHIIPIGKNPIEKVIRDLGDIAYGTFKTASNYTYQFSKKFDALVTFVENTLIPDAAKKKQLMDEYNATLVSVLKEDKVIIQLEEKPIISLTKEIEEKKVETKSENHDEVGAR